jgi:uncharacterized protein (DUF433 family)
LWAAREFNRCVAHRKPLAKLATMFIRLNVRSVLMIDKQLILSSPDILGGTPVFAGTRVPIKNLMDYLEAGDSLDEFLDDFPSVSREHAVQVLELAKEALLAHATARAT